MAQNVKEVASKNLKKPKVAENSESCQNSKKLSKISKVAEKWPSKLWLSLDLVIMEKVIQYSNQLINQSVFFQVHSDLRKATQNQKLAFSSSPRTHNLKEYGL